MATAELERLLDEWAPAWSSAEQNDPERVLALFADDYVFEDVSVVRGRAGQRGPAQLREPRLCGSP
jgi:hypothetical protein